MMYICNLLGILLRLTPKCHPKIASRGIKHAWGYSKLRFQINFNDAVARNLKENVVRSLSSDVLTVDRVRKFAKKAREYKLTYALLFHLSDGEELGSIDKDKIEHIIKLFKAHRSAMDADYRLISNA